MKIHILVSLWDKMLNEHCVRWATNVCTVINAESVACSYHDFKGICIQKKIDGPWRCRSQANKVNGFRLLAPSQLMLIMPPSPSVKQRDEPLQLNYQLKRCKENTISFLLFLLPLYPKRSPFLAIIQTLIPPNTINTCISEVGKGVYETSALRKDVTCKWKLLFALEMFVQP